MTILVGVKCTDGVVIGVDSIATSAQGPRPLVQVMSNDKLQPIGNKGLLATTGSVGLAQRVKLCADAMWSEQKYSGGIIPCSMELSRRTLENLAASHVQKSNGSIGIGALLGMVIDNNAELVEFDVMDFQPEVKQGNLFYVSMGSGQLLADPFLAFVSRVLWHGKMPDVKLGKAGVFWVLDHTIKYAPGGVGAPIKLGVLQKVGIDWKAETFDDTQEQSQFIEELERKIGPELAMEGGVPSSPPKIKGQ